jgi:hypothetical protein
MEAVIEAAKYKDYNIIAKDTKRFDKFNWNDFKKTEVYKIRQKNDEIILGLMSITDHSDPATDALEIGLLEVSAENIGTHKLIDRISGCLIAFACREAIKRGHEGYVFLVPKTGLIDHYIAKYGFLHFPMRSTLRPEGIMILHESNSRALIKKYIG